MKWNNNGGMREPEFWPNGDPKMDVRIAFADQNGDLRTFQFAEAGFKQRENPNHTHNVMASLTGSISSLVGHTVHIMTWQSNPETGQPWGLNNPRLFVAALVPDIKYELNAPLPEEFKVPKLYANTGVSGGQAAAPQMHGQYFAAPTMQYQQYAQPQYQQQYAPQPQYQQQYAPQQQYQQPQYQQQYAPQPQYQQQPVQATIQQLPPQAPQATAQMPQGMDPMVAAAMQAVGAQNVQPVYPDIPF